MRKDIRILSVEDNEVDALLIKRAIQRDDWVPHIHRVDSDEDLRAALADGHWDIALIDFTLPQYSAAKAIETVLQHDALLPAVVVSGTIGEERAVDLMRAGARDIVIKSNLERLPAVVQREVADSIERRRHERDKAKVSRLETTLAASKQRFSQVVDNTKEGICTISSDGKLTFANQGFGEMLGRNPDTLIGTTLHDLLDDPSRQLAQKRRTQLTNGLPVSDTFEGTFVGKDGGLVNTLITSTPFIGDGGWMGSMFLITNITELRGTEAALRQSQRVESLGVLAGGLAHDINNMLTPVLTLTEIALREVPDGSIANECLSKALLAAERATETVKQLLAFSRAETPERQVHQFQHVVRNAVALVRATMPATVKVDGEVPEGDGYVLTDPTQIHQLLMNLASNARDAMRDKGTLTISLQRLESTATLGTKSVDDGPCMILKVRDTGDGIPTEAIERVFDPFFTTKGVNEGTGLGLSVVHGIVKNHEGEILVRSQPGEGTEFSIVFPVLPHKAGATGKRNTTQAEAGTSGEPSDSAERPNRRAAQ